MPIYDYKCRDCGDRFEVEQSITDDALTTLPDCPEGGDHQLKKVFHPVGIAFKGSGFYKNDARGKSSSGSSSGGSGSSDSSSSTGSSSGDSSSSSSAGSGTSGGSGSSSGSSSSD